MSFKDSRSIAESLAAIRDGALVVGAIIYALGYAVWSLVAARYDLGARPVLDAQYLVAGFPILLAL